MQYLDYEGNIPKGEYGGGAMIVWDRGRWSSAADPDKGLAKGHLDITLHGDAAARPLAPGPHAAAARREDRAVAADQGRRRIRAAGRRARHHRRGDDVRSSAAAPRASSPRPGELRKDHAGRAKVTARARRRCRTRSDRGARKGILPAFLEPSLPRRPTKAAHRPKVGARDQVRRLSHAGAHRRAGRSGCYPQGARLDGALSEHRRRAAEAWASAPR